MDEQAGGSCSNGGPSGWLRLHLLAQQLESVTRAIHAGCPRNAPPPPPPCAQGNAGGAILAYKGSTLTIDRCSFVGNVAANDGGAIQQLGGVIMIGNSSFSQNTAASIGGAYFGSNVVRPRALLQSAAALSWTIHTQRRRGRHSSPICGSSMTHAQGIKCLGAGEQCFAKLIQSAEAWP